MKKLESVLWVAAVAMVMALDRAIKRGGSKGESVYDTRDLIVF